MTPPVPARVVALGVREYGEVWRLQQELVAARQRGDIPDTLLLVEHPDVITLGRGARPEHMQDAGGVPVFEVERGGDITFHGPGQLVGYPLLLLREHERDLHRYLRDIEEALIRALADFAIPARRNPGLTGVWTDAGARDGRAGSGEGAAAMPRKIASIGIAVKRWVTLHGFALNVATDLARFRAIRPCGLDAATMTSMADDLGRPVSMADVSAAVVHRLGEVCGRSFTPAQAPDPGA